MIRIALAVTVAFFLADAAKAQSPSELATRINQLDQRLTVQEKKLESVDSKLDAILNAVTAKAPAVASKAPVAATKAIASAPLDHTHTCANGHTWNHSMDGGTHVCPTCGLQQWIQDPVYGQATTMKYSLGSNLSSGCANGQCNTIQYSSPPRRQGLFFRRR